MHMLPHLKLRYRRSENFRCKNIFVVCSNHENKKHEIYLIIIARTFLFAQFKSKTQLGSYFAGDGLFFDTSRSLELIANA